MKYFSGKGIVFKEEFSVDRRLGKQLDTGIFYNSLFNQLIGFDNDERNNWLQMNLNLNTKCMVELDYWIICILLLWQSATTSLQNLCMNYRSLRWSLRYCFIQWGGSVLSLIQVWCHHHHSRRSCSRICYSAV